MAVADWTFDPNAGRNSVLPEDRFINAGNQHVRECLARAMRNLPPASAYEWYLRTHPRQAFGTCCSGTDSPVLAVDIVRLAVEDAFGVAWAPEHKFTAEISKRKREFLFEVLTKGEEGNGSGDRFLVVYGDCTALGGGGTPYEFGTKQGRAVDLVQWVFWRFPCQDVSSLCAERAKHRESFNGGGGGHV